MDCSFCPSFFCFFSFVSRCGSCCLSLTHACHSSPPQVEHNGERVQGRLLTEIGSGRWSVQVAEGKQEEFSVDQLRFPVDNNNNTATETDSAGSSQNAVSAREVRSRRRQEVEATKKKKKRKASPTNTTTTTTTKTTTTVPTNKRPRTTSDQPECVKIKLLTGTLILYRGRNQRAEFVRRV